MNVYSQVDGLLYRIGYATGALRARTIDTTRIEHNGGTSVDLKERVDEVVKRLEKVASELERRLA